MNTADQGFGRTAALPVALWVKILRLVPQQQRLIKCALVDTVWAAAAAQATEHLVLDVERTDGDAVYALQSWLAQHAGHLLTIKIRTKYYCNEHTLRLPLDQLTQLQRLQLEGFKLQLPDEEDSQSSSPDAGSRDSSAAGSIHAAMGTLPSLQHLELDRIELASVSSLLQLTKAPQLTSLLLTEITLAESEFQTSSSSCSGSEAAVQEVADAMPGLLQQLPQLSVLKLPHFPFTDAVARQAGALQGLQSISLGKAKGPLCNLQLLPSSITRIELHGGCNCFTLPSELPQLSGLLQLELEECNVPVSVLSSLTQLRVLHMMEYCKILLAVGGEQDDPQVIHIEALLDALLQLTQLRDLKLQLSTLDLDISSIAPERFAALTASSHLTQLFLTRDHNQNLPQGAIQHMFPVGRQMPSLQRLGFNVEASDDRYWCLSSADLQRISECCPQLQWLDICGSVDPRADLSVLLQLPASCTALLVGGAAFDDAAVPAVLQLTQLKHLSWSWATELTDNGLEQLVAMDLDSFHLLNCGLSQELHPNECDDNPVELEADPVLGSVSQQLDALCDLSPVLAPARFPKYRKKAEAEQRRLRLENKRLRIQLARSQAEVWTTDSAFVRAAAVI